MATSQNGWAAITSGTEPRLTPLAWVTGRVLTGDVHTVLDHLAARYQVEVEPIVRAHSWGWAYRPVTGGESLSNHASGTAIDLNAPAHPLAATGTFTPAQRAAIHRILADLGGVVRWGGDYTGRKDEMHFEIVGTPAQVAAVAGRIRAGQLTTPNEGPANLAAASTPTTEEDDMLHTVIALYITHLGRLPDAAGAASWITQVAEGRLTWAQVGESLRSSPESAEFAALGSEDARNQRRNEVGQPWVLGAVD